MRPRRHPTLNWASDRKAISVWQCSHASTRASWCTQYPQTCTRVPFQILFSWMAPRWTLKWPDDSKMFALFFWKWFTAPLQSLLHLKRWRCPPPIITLILCHYKHYGCYLQLCKGWYWYRQTHTKCSMYLFFPSFAEVFSLLLNSQTQYDIDWVLSHHSFGGFNTKE